MAAFPCPYCGHSLTPGVDPSTKLERCPGCDQNLLIAYRYRLIEAHKRISGGQLYLALDDGFDEKVAVLFVDDPKDTVAVERFVAGTSLFADFGGRGLVKIRELGAVSDRRAYVVMDWLEGGTLDVVVKSRGAIPQAALLELVADLLTGLSKAHRSMPSVVHGHVHPGKIGFNRHHHAVLFGFEWATQINSQTSRLADSFVTEAERKDPRSPAGDVRQLGSSFYYAATGEWLGDKSVAIQRERVRSQLPGPLGTLVDRMLGAGVDGYRSAVDATIDFEQLMRGVNRWTPPSAVANDRRDEPVAAVWTPSTRSATDAEPDDEGEDEDEDNDEDEDDEDPDEIELAAVEQIRAENAFARGQQPRPPADTNWLAINAMRQAEASRQAAVQTANPTANVGRNIAIAIGTMCVVGTCVAGMVADEQSKAEPPAQFRGAPGVEPIPTPAALPVPIPEPIAEPIVEPMPDRFIPPSQPELGTVKYTGTITGPATYAGLTLDQACEIWVEPQGGNSCRWFIDCGEPDRHRIYGGGTAGYSTCTYEDGRPTFAQDEDDDGADGAFLANFGTEDRMLVVKDRWLLPPVQVFISVDEGSFDPGPIPDTALAPRVDRDEIERQIALGVYPEIEPGKLADW